MAETIEFGIKLTADGSALVGTMQVSKAQVDQLKQSLQGTSGAVQDLGKQSDVAGGLLRKLAGYLTVGSIAAWANGVVDAAARLKDLQAITGSSVESLSRLSNIAIISGQGTDLLRLGLERLSYAMNSSDLEATRAQKALAFLGISAKDPAQAFQQLADKLALYADGTGKAAIVQDIMGRGAQNLLPLIQKLAENHQIAATTTALQAVEAQKLEEELRALSVQAGGLKDVLLSDVVPAMVNTIAQFTEGIRIAGGFWEALRLFGLETPFASTEESAKKLRDELDRLNKIQAEAATESPLTRWFFNTFGHDTQKMLDDTTKKLQFITFLQGQQLNLPPGGDPALDTSVPKKPLPYKSPALGAAGAGDATLQGFYAVLAAQEQAEEASAKSIEQAQQDTYRRQFDQATTFHKLWLLSDQEFSDNEIQIARNAADAQIAYASSVLASQKAELAAAQTKAPTTPKEEQEQAKAMLDLKNKIAASEGALGRAIGARADVERTADNAGLVLTKKRQDAETALDRGAQDFLQGISDQNDDLQFQISLLGKSETEQRQLTAARDAQRAIDKEILDLNRQIKDLHDSDPDLVDKINAKIVVLRGSVQHLTTAIVQSTAVLDAGSEHMQGLKDAWQEVDNVAQGAAQAFTQSWSSGIDYIKQQLETVLVRYLTELAEKQFILPLFISATGAPAGFGQGAGSFPTLNAFSSAFGGSSGIGSIFGSFGSDFTAAAAGDAFLPGALAGGAEAGIGSTLGAAFAGLAPMIPYIGIALAAASALGLFDSKPSDVRGKFAVSGGTGGFEDNAFTSTKFGNIGFADAGTQQFGGDAAQTFNKVIAGTLDAIASRLTPEQIKAATGELQGINFQGMEGTFTTEDFIKKYGGDILKQVISTVFEQLNPALATMVKNFSGTADEITAYANGLLSINDAISGNVATDAAKAYALATQSSVQAIATLRQNMIDLTVTFDGSAQSVNDLANASTSYRAALVQELVQIKQIEAALHDMFNQTRQSIEFAGLDNQSAYNLYQKKATDDFAKLQVSDDPAEIQRLASEIDQYISDAFNLLSPDQQLAQKATFLKQLDDTDKLINARLNKIGDRLAADSVDPFAAVKTALDDAATKMNAAADKQNQAANTNLQAANTFADSAGDMHVSVTVNTTSDAVGT